MNVTAPVAAIQTPARADHERNLGTGIGEPTVSDRGLREQLIEEMAKAMWGTLADPEPWAEADLSDQAIYLGDARAGLDAALGLLRERHPNRDDLYGRQFDAVDWRLVQYENGTCGHDETIRAIVDDQRRLLLAVLSVSDDYRRADHE
jgi:hypothetical protein